MLVSPDRHPARLLELGFILINRRVAGAAPARLRPRLIYSPWHRRSHLQFPSRRSSSWR